MGSEYDHADLRRAGGLAGRYVSVRRPNGGVGRLDRRYRDAPVHRRDPRHARPRHACPRSAIRRYNLVEIKPVEELTLSALSPPHHRPLPANRSADPRNHGPTAVSTRVLQHYPPKATKALGNPRAADVHAVRDRRPPTRSKPALLEVYRPNIPKNSSIRYFSVSYHTELPLS